MNDIVTAILSTGEIFGELAVAGEDKRKDYAQVINANTTICQLSISELQELMKESWI